MSMATTAEAIARPTWRQRWRSYGRSPRIVGVDVARALAVFGMIAVHVGVVISGEPNGAPGWSAVFEGRSSILFAVVAGISIALATGGGSRPMGEAVRSARLRLAGRAIAVLAIGLALELMGTEIAVILSVYGVLFLLIIPFVGVATRTLVIVAAALAVGGPTLLALITSATGGAPGSGVQFLLTGSYPLTVWMPLMLAGLAAGRADLQRTRTVVVVAASGAALCVVGYVSGALVAGSPTAWLTSLFPSGASASFANGAVGAAMSGASGINGSISRSATDLPTATDLTTAIAEAWAVAPHSGGTFEIIGSGGFALLVVGLCVLLGRRLRTVLVPLAAVGAMPLTAYAAHVLSFAVLVSPLAIAPGVLDADGRSAAFWMACIAVLLVGCTAWALLVGRGPLERVTAWAAEAVDRPRPASESGVPC